MACFHPIPAVQMESGEVSLSFHDRALGSPLQLPCGSCVGCRTDRVLSWSLRCQHEAACWDVSYVLTLTYDDEHLPPLSVLRPRDMQLFLKRVRKAMSGDKEVVPGSGLRPIRFFGVGEYGDRTSRPHFHILLFNAPLSDLKAYDKRHLKSSFLDETWGMGSVVVDRMSPEACSYVAGYALKKVKRVERSQPVELVDMSTGECVDYVPPFARMSNRPGIGAFWYDKYHRDLLRGYVPVAGKKLSTPRYYKEKLKRDFPAQMDLLVEERDRRELDRLESDPTYLYRRSEAGRAASEQVALAKKNLFRATKTF